MSYAKSKLTGRDLLPQKERERKGAEYEIGNSGEIHGYTCIRTGMSVHLTLPECNCVRHSDRIGVPIPRTGQ